MARASAAAVAAVAQPEPAQRRKPGTRGNRPHGVNRSRVNRPRVNRPTSTAAAVAVPRRAPARKPASRSRSGASRTRTAPLVQRLIRGRAGAIADQLLRGRACVAIVFALLVGIVFLNVSLLEMNEGIARTNAKATALEHENAKLRTQLAPLGSSERIQREAVKRGYSLPAAGDVGYVSGSASDNAKKAVERMTAPGMGEGTASRPAAMVQEEQAANGTTTTTPPAQPTAPVATATPSPATPPPATPAPVAATAP